MGARTVEVTTRSGVFDVQVSEFGDGRNGSWAGLVMPGIPSTEWPGRLGASDSLAVDNLRAAIEDGAVRIPGRGYTSEQLDILGRLAIGEAQPGVRHGISSKGILQAPLHELERLNLVFKVQGTGGEEQLFLTGDGSAAVSFLTQRGVLQERRP